MVEPIQATNLREELLEKAPGWLKGAWGTEWLDTFGYFADALAEDLRRALLAPWLLELDSPQDVLPWQARERGLQRYPVETDEQHRTRLHEAWEIWANAGSGNQHPIWGDNRSELCNQLEAAGWPDCLIYNDIQPGWALATGLDWSQFWVVIPAASHTYSHGGTWGTGQWGDGRLWGVTGITREEVNTLRGIVQKFKPLDWRCDGIIAVIAHDDPTLTAPGDFSDPAWTKGTDTTVTADDITGPEVGSLADKIANTAGGSSSTCYVDQALANTDNAIPAVISFDVKAGTATWVMVQHFAGTNTRTWFDLTNGVIGTRGSACLRAWVTNLGNGWWRVSAAYAAAFLTHPRLQVVDGDGVITCADTLYAYAYQALPWNGKISDYVRIGAS